MHNSNHIVPRRILIVDDEADIEPLFRQALRHEIRSGRLDITFALDGVTALDLIANPDLPAFDVIISDLNMPGMHGFDFLRQLIGYGPAMSLAIVSANADDSTRLEADTIGVDAFFSKPIDFDIMRDYVTAA